MGATIFIVIVCLIFIVCFLPRAILNMIDFINVLAEIFKDAFKSLAEDWRELWGLIKK